MVPGKIRTLGAEWVIVASRPGGG